MRACGSQVNDRFGIGIGLEDRTALLEDLLQGPRIGQVAIVGNREAAACEFGKERLDVADARVACGGIACMPDRPAAVQPVDHRLFGELVADQSDVTLGMKITRRHS